MKQRNHMSMRLAVRMRRVSDAVLAQSLDAGGRQGEWAKEAAHECSLARVTDIWPWEEGVPGSQKGPCKRDRIPYYITRKTHRRESRIAAPGREFRYIRLRC